MAKSDMPDYLLKQDAGGHVDIGHLCVERLFVVFEKLTLIRYRLISTSEALKQAMRDGRTPEPETG